LLVPVTDLRESRDIKLIDGDLVPGEHRRFAVFDLGGSPHEVQVSEETFDALVRLTCDANGIDLQASSGPFGA
jgi:hypothetical protein